MKLNVSIYNTPPGARNGDATARVYKPQLVRAAKKGQPHEILVHGPIGRSYWSDNGVSSTDFINALSEIPAGEKVTVGVNSQGGEVGEGLAIYNAIARRAADITVRIDGYALSIASVFPLAAGKVVSPKSAVWMIHLAWNVAQGNADEMRANAELLDTHDRAIISAYVKKTGKGQSAIRAAMAKTTWMTGEEAIDYGLADEEGENEPALDAIDFSAASEEFRKAIPAALLPKMGLLPAAAPRISAPQGAGKPTPHKNLMNRERLLALLKKHGITPPDNATDEQLLALVDTIPAASAPPPQGGPSGAGAGNPNPAPQSGGGTGGTPDPLAQRIVTLEAAYAAERRTRITAAVQECVDQCRIPASQRDGWITRAMADEAVLADLRALPENRPGADPIGATPQIVAEDPRTIDRAVCSLFNGVHAAAEALVRAQRRAQIIAANLPRILAVWNANTISADLKRTVILQQSMRAFAIRVLSLMAFSTRLNGVRLEGTNKVAVPYFPLDTTASTDFVANDGYNVFGNTNADAKVVEVDKRKYQGLSWTSEELARQPFLDMVMSASLKSEQLGIDTVNTVLGAVTVANFGASVKAEQANAFDSDDVIDLKGVADLANWPAGGRSLILNSAYDINLLKDTAIKSALNFGDSTPIREGRIVRLAGFDYYPDGRVPANNENLEGFISFKSALLVAFAPIGPTPEVRAALTRYEVVTDPSTGATFEYRLWGDPDKDQSKEIIEANFGFAVGEAAALKRITNQ